MANNAAVLFNISKVGIRYVGTGAGGGGGGHTITVNGSALASATAADFDDAVPAAPANGFNIKWQKDALDPTNISGYLDTTALATSTWGSGSAITFTYDVGAVDPVIAYTSGNVKWSGATTYTYEGGATDPVWTPGNGVMNLSTGTLQQGGTNVGLVGNCTNQFVRNVNNAAPTCAAVVLTLDVTGTLPEANLPDMSTTAQGVVEAAINTEVDTGTDATRAITPDVLAGSVIFRTQSRRGRRI